MNIFEENDYREIIRKGLKERLVCESPATFQALAAHLNIPRSYLSKVMHGNADLSGDQMFKLCAFFHFNDEESEYMHLLLEAERTGLKDRRLGLKQKLKSMRTKHLDTAAHLASPSVFEFSSADMSDYYLDPFVQLVHVALSVPRYQRDLLRLAHDIKAPHTKVLGALEILERMQLITRAGSLVKVLTDSLHLPRQSNMYRAWHNQVKMRGLNRLSELNEDQAYSYAVVFSATDEVRIEIQQRFLKVLKGIEKVAREAPAENVFQMGFELFSWT